MFLKDILAISGQGGLFKFIKQARNGIIVESIDTNKRMNAHSTAKISSLEDITIFSEGENDLSLFDVMKRIFEKEKGEKAIDQKSSNDDLKKYFEGVVPEYDKERVYVSDIKKVISWYNILQSHNLIVIEEEKEEEKPEDDKAKENKISGAIKKTTATSKKAAINKNITKPRAQQQKKTATQVRKTGDK